MCSKRIALGFYLISIFLFSYSNAGEPTAIPAVVIGSGPAGLTAAAIIARAGIPVTVITGKEVGGKLTEAKLVENIPGKKKATGAKIMEDFKQQAIQFGAKLMYDTVERVDFSQRPFTLTTAKGKQLKANTVIIATGGSPHKPQVPNIDKYWGNGIGYCSICDAPFNKNQNVAIIGSSDYAIDQALQLATFAKQVTFIVPEEQTKMELTTSKRMREYLEATPNIRILYNTEITNIKGENNKLTSIEIKNKSTGTIEQLFIKGLYCALGYEPNTALFKDILELNPEGYIKVKDSRQRTSIDGVFAAGNVEVEDKILQKAGVAAGRGEAAGLAVIDYLQAQGFTPLKLEFSNNQLLSNNDAVKEANTVSDLKSEIARNKYVIVEFFAHYCSHCREIAPHFEAVAQEYSPNIKFLKVDIEKLPDTIDIFNISGIPYIQSFADGKPRTNIKGVHTKQQIKNLAEELIEQKIML